MHRQFPLHGLVLLGFLSATVHAQSSASGSSRGSASSAAGNDTSFSVARNGVIDITVGTGRLMVRGSERATAELRTNRTDYQLRSSGISVTLAVAGDDDRRRGSRRSDEPDIDLLVPKGVRLVIHGASADVGVSGVAGDVEVHLQSGDVLLETLGGRAIVETISGDVGIVGGVGDLRVSTVSGDLTARGVRGSIDVHSTSGNIAVSAERATRAEVATTSGDVVFEGALGVDARLQFTSHSGDVTLRLPESAAGELEATTFNGDVSGGIMTLMPSSESGARSRNADRATRRFEFGGGGSARIIVTTFTGDISVQRGARRRIE